MNEWTPATPQSSGWVTVRCVFRTERQDGRFYEERLTLWRTSSMDDAVERAEAEAHEYARDVSSADDTTVYTGLAQAFLLADDLEEGAEVYSLIRGSDVDTGGYLDAFFATGTERSQEISDDEETGGSGKGIEGF